MKEDTWFNVLQSKRVHFSPMHGSFRTYAQTSLASGFLNAEYSVLQKSILFLSYSIVYLLCAVFLKWAWLNFLALIALKNKEISQHVLIILHLFSNLIYLSCIFNLQRGSIFTYIHNLLLFLPLFSLWWKPSSWNHFASNP